MKRKIIRVIQATILLLVLALSTYSPVSAASCSLTSGSGGLSGGALEISPWYKYLPGDNSSGACRPAFPKKANGSTDITKAATLITAAVIELLTRVAGLIAAGFVIYGAIQYITSQGEPEGLANAKNTITNALIGFVIVVLAIAIIQFTGRAFK